MTPRMLIGCTAVVCILTLAGAMLYLGGVPMDERVGWSVHGSDDSEAIPLFSNENFEISFNASISAGTAVTGEYLGPMESTAAIFWFTSEAGFISTMEVSRFSSNVEQEPLRGFSCTNQMNVSVDARPASCILQFVPVSPGDKHRVVWVLEFTEQVEQPVVNFEFRSQKKDLFSKI